MNLEPLPSIYSIESLEKWLRKFAPQTLVGTPRNCERCPAACWLREEFGGNANVGLMIILGPNSNGDAAIYRRPDWLTQFAGNIDKINGKITAAKALKVLESVKKGMQ